MGNQTTTLKGSFNEDSEEFKTIIQKIQLQADAQIHSSKLIDEVEDSLDKNLQTVVKLHQSVDVKHADIDSLLQRARQNLEAVRTVKRDILGIGPTTDRNNVIIPISNRIIVPNKNDFNHIEAVEEVIGQEETDGVNSAIHMEEVLEKKDAQEETFAGLRNSMFDNEPTRTIGDDNKIESNIVREVKQQAEEIAAPESPAPESPAPENDNDTTKDDVLTDLGCVDDNEIDPYLLKEDKEYLEESSTAEKNNDTTLDDVFTDSGCVDNVDSHLYELNILVQHQEEKLQKIEENLRLSGVFDDDEDLVGIDGESLMPEDDKLSNLCESNEFLEQVSVTEVEQEHGSDEEVCSNEQENQLHGEVDKVEFKFAFAIKDFVKQRKKMKKGLTSSIVHIAGGRPHLQAEVGFYPDKTMLVCLSHQRCDCPGVACSEEVSRNVKVKVTVIDQKTGNDNFDIGSEDMVLVGFSEAWSSGLVCMAKSKEIERRKLVHKNRVVLQYEIIEM